MPPSHVVSRRQVRVDELCVWVSSEQRRTIYVAQSSPALRTTRGGLVSRSSRLGAAYFVPDRRDRAGETGFTRGGRGCNSTCLRVRLDGQPASLVGACRMGMSSSPCMCLTGNLFKHEYDRDEIRSGGGERQNDYPRDLEHSATVVIST